MKLYAVCMYLKKRTLEILNFAILFLSREYNYLKYFYLFAGIYFQLSPSFTRIKLSTSWKTSNLKISGM